MESFLNRYRNITVLLLVIFAQLVLVAVQVKNDQDVRIIRVWTVTAVTPVARVIEAVRGGTFGFLRGYILLHDTNEENRRLRTELDRAKLDNIFLKNELNTADRAKALQVFQAHTPSRAVAASVIGTGAGTGSKVVFVDRGSVAGIQRGMAVVTPDGIVGKVIAAYPTASEVLLVTDPDFAAGVISQKTQLRGTLKGQGTPMCKVDYVPQEEKLEPGEWFYTSGDDRVYPRGFPVGIVKMVRPGQPFKEIYVEPSGLQHGIEDVLILVEGVHQAIPDVPPTNQPVYIASPPPPPPAAPGAATGAPAPPAGSGSGSGTEADKLRAQYKAIGDAQNHKFGEGLPGSKPPNFNMPLPPPGSANPAPKGPAGAPPARPPAAATTPGTQNPAPNGPAGAPPARPPAGTAPGTQNPTPNGPAAAQPARPPAGTPPAGPGAPDAVRRANQGAAPGR
jgi:rod shape-determining protein MreC